MVKWEKGGEIIDVFTTPREDWAPPRTEEGDSGPRGSGRTIIENVNDFEKLVPPTKCVRDRWYAGQNGLWVPVEKEIYSRLLCVCFPWI
jgi:hypothetical protein